MLYGFIGIALTALCGLIYAEIDTISPDVSQYFIHTDINARVVGGTEAPEASVPYMVGLHNGFPMRSFVCGGSLVTTRSVLTAAHCIVAVYNAVTGLSSNLRGRIGSHQHSSGGVAYRFSYNFTHPDYVGSVIKNDIGLLITTTEVELSDSVSLVPLSYDFVGGGVRSRVAGWGRIAAGDAISPVLLELYLDTIDGERCVQEVVAASIEFGTSAPHVDPDLEICTLHSPGYGVCNGDSGSALVEVSSGREIAIVSWGFPCARGAPDMFVRVSAYEEWLQEHIL